MRHIQIKHMCLCAVPVMFLTSCSLRNTDCHFKTKFFIKSYLEQMALLHVHVGQAVIPKMWTQ